MFWMPCQGWRNWYRLPLQPLCRSDRKHDGNLGYGVRQLPLESHCGLTNCLNMGSTLHLSAPVSPVEEQGEILIKALGGLNAEMVILRLLARHFIANCKGFLVFETVSTQNLDSLSMDLSLKRPLVFLNICSAHSVLSVTWRYFLSLTLGMRRFWVFPPPLLCQLHGTKKRVYVWPKVFFGFFFVFLFLLRRTRPMLDLK